MGVIKNDLRSGVERDYPVFNFFGIRTNGKRDRIWHYLAACDCAERDCIASRGYYGLVRILPPDIHFCETKNDATRVETYRDSSERNVFGSHVMKVQSRKDVVTRGQGNLLFQPVKRFLQRRPTTLLVGAYFLIQTHVHPFQGHRFAQITEQPA